MKTVETMEILETGDTVETAEKVETVETNIPAYTILKYSKEVFHMKVINIFKCQHIGVSMINLNT